jgi:hypothetical protein
MVSAQMTDKFSPSGLLWAVAITTVIGLQLKYDFPVEMRRDAFFYVTIKGLSVFLAAYGVGDIAYKKLSHQRFVDKLYGLGKLASVILIFSGIYFCISYILIRSVFSCVADVGGGLIVSSIILIPASLVAFWLLIKLIKLTKSPDIVPLIVVYFAMPPFVGILTYIIDIPYYLLGASVAYIITACSKRMSSASIFN